MGDAGVGHVVHNNGVEANWPSFISAVCGSAGKNKWMKIDVFVSNMLKYVADQSKEKALAQQHNYGTHRFWIYPEKSLQQWQSIQLLTNMVALLEFFHLLQPVRGQVKWKCSCKDFFRDGICTHTTLFAMLWYPDCQVPDEYSAVKVPTRPSSRRPGVFATISAKPTFEEMIPRAQGTVYT